MKTTTGQRALTDFSLVNNGQIDTTRMFINTHIETYTKIDSVKLGSYDRDGQPGWDQNWTELSLGTKDNDLKMDGFIIKADFKNLNTQNPQLKRFIIGTNRLEGKISGKFNSFTGTYNPALTEYDSDTETEYVRQNFTEMQDITDENGITNFNFNSDSSGQDQGFFLILSPDAANNSGIHAVMGYNENNISSTNWWDAP